MNEDRPNENGKIIGVSELGKEFEYAAYGEVIEVTNSTSYVTKNNYDNAITKQNQLMLYQMKEIEKSLKEMTQNPNNFKFYAPDKTRVDKGHKPMPRFK